MTSNLLPILLIIGMKDEKIYETANLAAFAIIQ